MKTKLMIQSMSPLALLTIINNFSFQTNTVDGTRFSCTEFICNNAVLLFVMLFCAIWVILGLLFFLSFGLFRWTGKRDGYSICSVSENEEASLNFFLTLIIPLLLDNVATCQGAITFFAILCIIYLLLSKTRLFYANPILTILGYHIYEFEFEDNNEFGREKLVGLCKGTVKNGQSIEYKKITESVLYIKGMKDYDR